MTCTPFRIRDANGQDAFGFMCSRGRGRRRPPCRACRWPSTKLCDGMLPTGKRCDQPICNRHATHVGPELDLCPACVAAGRRVNGPQQLELLSAGPAVDTTGGPK